MTKTKPSKITTKTTKKTIRPILKNKRKIIVLSFIALVLAVVGALTVLYVVPTINNSIRKDRIVAIYDSLGLGQAYILKGEQVFGDKRVYEWDAGRTYSSSRQYVRNDNVDTTVADLKRAVTAAGFSYVGEPYPGASDVQLHYKSAKNEYIRFTVSSKSRDDAFWNKVYMNIKTTPADLALDKNIGPSNVTIKVNLDDNNE